MPDFTVCTINWWSYKYILFLNHTLRELADFPDFQFLILNTTPGRGEQAELEKLSFSKTLYQHIPSISGSVAHGTYLNCLLPLIETKYTLILDPDSAVLAQGWDKLCIKELEKNKKTIAIGAPYARQVQQQRYGDFPTAFFCMYQTEFLQQKGIDFRPGWATPQGKVRRWIRRQGGKFETDRDTGWKIRQSALKNRQNGLCFTHFNNQIPGAVVLSNGERGDEYHWQGNPIFIHQGRSSSRKAFQESEVSVPWYKAVCRYLNYDPKEISNQLGLEARL